MVLETLHLHCLTPRPATANLDCRRRRPLRLFVFRRSLQVWWTSLVADVDNFMIFIRTSLTCRRFKAELGRSTVLGKRAVPLQVESFKDEILLLFRLGRETQQLVF